MSVVVIPFKNGNSAMPRMNSQRGLRTFNVVIPFKNGNSAILIIFKDKKGEMDAVVIPFKNGNSAIAKIKNPILTALKLDNVIINFSNIPVTTTISLV